MRVELKYQGDKQRMSEKNILEEIAEKTNKEQIEMCFKAYKDEKWQTQFD